MEQWNKIWNKRKEQCSEQCQQNNDIIPNIISIGKKRPATAPSDDSHSDFGQRGKGWDCAIET